MKKKRLLTYLLTIGLLCQLFSFMASTENNLAYWEIYDSTLKIVEPEDGYILPSVEEAEAAEKNLNFLQVRGQEIVDKYGTPYLIKGIGFGNGVWTTEANPYKFHYTNHHNESSYAQIRAMGFNTVRFYMAHDTFDGREGRAESMFYLDEQGNEQINWDCEGLKWLRQNVEWAKTHDIKLILNMHVPWGGQSSPSLFDRNEDGSLEENAEKLKKFWVAVARMFRSEPTILGYGFVNEPVVPLRTEYPSKTQNERETVYQWRNLANEISREVRAVDPNHIFFIERLQGISGDYNMWTRHANSQYIEDPNTAVEVHFYEPYHLTHIPADGMDGKTNFINNYKANGLVDFSYPNNDVIMAATGNCQEYVLPSEGSHQLIEHPNENGWKHFESKKYTVNNDNINYMHLVLLGQNLGNTTTDGSVYFDNILIKEYSDEYPNGRPIFSTSVSTYVDMYPYQSDLSVTYKADIGCMPIDSDVHIPEGLSKNGSIKMTNGEGMGQTDFNSAYRLHPKNGCSYTISCDMKYEGETPNAVYRPQLKFYSYDKVYPLDRSYLRYKINELKQFGNIVVKIDDDHYEQQYHPVFLGEFGVSTDTYECTDHDRCESNSLCRDGKGAERWLNDLYSVIEEDSKTSFPLGFSLHLYHAPWMGLYFHNMGAQPDRYRCNITLGDFLAGKLPQTNGYSNMILKIDSTSAFLNGNIVPAHAFRKSGTAAAPIRFIAESFGWQIDYDSATKKTTLTDTVSGDRIIVLKDNPLIEKQNKDGNVIAQTTAPIAPFLHAYTTYVPIRTICEFMGYQVNYKVDEQQNAFVAVSDRKFIITEEMMEQFIQTAYQMNL